MKFPTRREVLQRAAGGFGAIALHGMLAEKTRAANMPSRPAIRYRRNSRITRREQNA